VCEKDVSAVFEG
jgi:hypothetical protein